MTHFESFDNLEDMLGAINERAERAMENLHPVQRTIKPGDYVLIPKPEYGYLIFGKTYNDDEIVQGERQSGASEEEARYTAKHLASARERGYYFGRWYSVDCPTGEYGDNHVSGMWPITKSEFEEAQDNEWTLSTVTYIALLARLFPDAPIAEEIDILEQGGGECD